MVLTADATVKNTFEDAGAEQADAIISTTDQDATNVMVCLLAQEFEIPAILSVVHNPNHMDLFKQIGVNTMENPQQLIAEYLYRADDPSGRARDRRHGNAGNRPDLGTVGRTR